MFPSLLLLFSFRCVALLYVFIAVRQSAVAYLKVYLLISPLPRQQKRFKVVTVFTCTVPVSFQH